jgi:endonuclease III-like uncharacterized protein
MTDEAPKLIVKVSSSKSLNRKRQIQSVDSHVYQDRNQVIEEVAKEIEKMQGFGKDTIDSLTIYIRNMKT